MTHFTYIYTYLRPTVAVVFLRLIVSDKFTNTFVKPFWHTLTNIYTHLFFSQLQCPFWCLIVFNKFLNTIVQTTLTHFYKHLPHLHTFIYPHWQWPLWRLIVFNKLLNTATESFWNTFTQIYTHLFSHSGNGFFGAWLFLIDILIPLFNTLSHTFTHIFHIYQLHNGNDDSGAWCF